MTNLNYKKEAAGPADLLYGPQTPAEVKNIKTGYMPRPLQQVLHNSLKRFNVLVCHRRFGKTVCMVNELIDRALLNPLRNPHYAYIAPTYKQAKKIAWQYFVDYTRFLPGVTTNKSELTVYIERPGRRDPVTGELDPDTIEITLLGADDPDAIRGIYLDGSIIDEFAQCDPIIWGQVVRPALADRKKIAQDLGIFEDMGGIALEPWAVFIGTPKGQNHFYYRYEKAKGHELYCELYAKDKDIAAEREKWAKMEEVYGIGKDTNSRDRSEIIAKWPESRLAAYKAWRKFVVASNWFTSLYKASETAVLDQDEIDEMKEDLSPEEVDQELECSFTAAILGSYYGHIINQMRERGRIGNFPYNPKHPVDTYWDIGISDKLVIWFVQKTDAGYNYIDYYETNGKGVPELIQVLDAKKARLGSRIEVSPGEFIDGYGYRFGRHVWPHDGAAREFGTGNTRQEQARQQGLIVDIQQRVAKPDQISAVRTRLKISNFDEKKCARGLECLYNYQKEYDSKLMMFKDKPKHDWSSHGAEGFAYSALDDRPSYFPEDRRRWSNQQMVADNDYDEFAL